MNIPSTKLTKTAVFTVLIGSLFYAYEFFLQVSPGVMTDALMHAFNVNATILGTISGFFYYSYTIMQMPGGFLLDRYGARIVLTIVIAICTLGTLLFSLSTNAFTASIARLIIGAGSGFAFVGALYLIIRWIPIRYLALFIGLAQLLASIGAIGGEAPLEIMIEHGGWQHAMFVLFVTGVVLTILVALFVRDRPKHYEERAEHRPKIATTLRAVLGSAQTWYIAVYSFAIWAPMTAFAALWGIPFLTQADHLTPIAAADAMIFIWLGVAIGSPFIGWISDYFERRCWPLIVSAIIGLLSIMIVIYKPNLNYDLLLLLLFILGLSASGQSLVFAVIKDNNYVYHSGAANGFNNMVIVSTGAIFQPLIGKILDLTWSGSLHNGIRLYSLHSYQLALMLVPLSLFVAILMSAFFIRETNCMPKQ
ncbi:MAG: hypothetical protein A3C55_05375 [Gammaproteobacteria bacterium RIFCSPHIGHO2_02_FULL_42_13]|nr:MAG: hypothetical protein A3C55_05375 [Gammaproteobacteria bacterium RIFCSPHIGHO2_02_FULL_42_13]OGT68498.1 MAG: hypothetical protein A3H43_05865 [Gammaproteobacteria bacterium RIFCSPLOWO2_02_FULL_42_9]